MSGTLDRDASVERDFNGKGMRIAIVQARFNRAITDRLVDGAMSGLQHYNVDAHNIDIMRVPGSFELALVAQRAARTKKYDAVICIGAVIRGETAHFEIVATQTASGIAAVSRQEDIPIIFCVLTTDTIKQALRRSGVKGENTGWSAALAAIEMAGLLRKIDGNR